MKPCLFSPLLCPIRPSGVIRAILTGVTPVLCHHKVHCFQEGEPLKSQVIFTCLQMNWVSYFMHTLVFWYLYQPEGSAPHGPESYSGITKTPTLLYFAVCLQHA